MDAVVILEPQVLWARSYNSSALFFLPIYSLPLPQLRPTQPHVSNSQIYISSSFLSFGFLICIFQWSLDIYTFVFCRNLSPNMSRLHSLVLFSSSFSFSCMFHVLYIIISGTQVNIPFLVLISVFWDYFLTSKLVSLVPIFPSCIS